jgi:hypothetical protein
MDWVNNEIFASHVNLVKAKAAEVLSSGNREADLELNAEKTKYLFVAPRPTAGL